MNVEKSKHNKIRVRNRTKREKVEKKSESLEGLSGEELKKLTIVV